MASHRSWQRVGTVFNTITKSGTNDYHGEGGFIFRRTPLSARPKLLPASVATPDVNLNSYFADGGGRIVRDKLFSLGPSSMKPRPPSTGDGSRRCDRATRPSSDLCERHPLPPGRLFSWQKPIGL